MNYELICMVRERIAKQESSGAKKFKASKEKGLPVLEKEKGSQKTRP